MKLFGHDKSPTADIDTAREALAPGGDHQAVADALAAMEKPPVATALTPGEPPMPTLGAYSPEEMHVSVIGEMVAVLQEREATLTDEIKRLLRERQGVRHEIRAYRAASDILNSPMPESDLSEPPREPATAPAKAPRVRKPQPAKTPASEP